MSYESKKILCRKCLEREIPEGELLEYLDGYVASLPEVIRADESVYKERLEKCADCKHRITYTCTLCGCYVQARAAKRGLCCPIADEPLWTAQT